MIIYNKIKNTKLIINIVILILIYFFSFHIFPKLSFYNKLEYRKISVNNNYLNILSLVNTKKHVDMIFADDAKLNHEKNKFLNQYFSYLIKNNNLISDAPCPNELMANNLRNIQIFNEDANFIDNSLEFNVRFSFYKYFWSSEKLDMDKCFDYIFKENLNKYFLLNRKKLVEKIEDNIKFINFLISKQEPENPKKVNNLLFSTFLGEVEKGNVVSVVITGNSIKGTFANGTKFRTYSPNYTNLVDKLSSNGVSFSGSRTEEQTEKSYNEVNKLENFIRIIKSINYFIDPNVSYTFTQQNDKSFPKIIAFIMCLLIFVFINIGFNKFNKKQISKFINKFMNS